MTKPKRRLETRGSYDDESTPSFWDRLAIKYTFSCIKDVFKNIVYFKKLNNKHIILE